MTPTRPVLRWHGSKWRIAPWVIAHFPLHKVYLEPFGGGASVLLRKPRVRTEIYNDLDADVVNLFRVLRQQARDLALALSLTPYARDEYDSLYEPCEEPVEAARRFVARSFMGMNSKGALQKSGFDTRVNPDAFVSRLRSYVAIPDELAAVADRLQHVIIEHGDGVNLLARHDRADALVYVDPPYLSEVRSGKYYRHEMDVDDHSRLLDAISSTSAMVVLSGYDNPLYAGRLGAWQRLELSARTDGGAERTEVLWINPPAWAALPGQRPQSDMFGAG